MRTRSTAWTSSAKHGARAAPDRHSMQAMCSLIESARSSRKDAYGFGFEAQTGEYVNLMSNGIIDPTKVVRAALQGAASVAGLLITTEAMVAELP